MTTAPHINPVDRVEILTLVDNAVDLLLPSSDVAKRLGPSGLEGQPLPTIEAPLMASNDAMDGPVAEHGLSFLVTVVDGGERRSVLFDTGSSVTGLLHNLHVLGVDPSEIEAIVLSHGHFDHTTGLQGLAAHLQPLPTLVVHPDVWLRRRVYVPGREPWELPVVVAEKLRAAGFRIIEARGPSSLLDGGLLVTGEIERRTEFEQGLIAHQAFQDGQWQADPFLLDDQALVANVRGKGLVVITGCSHAGLINTVYQARKLTGVEEVYAVAGGFHLGGPLFEPIIPPTIEALRAFEPEVIAPVHCTGWRAIHALAAAFPEAFVPGSVGTTYVLDSGEVGAGH